MPFPLPPIYPHTFNAMGSPCELQLYADDPAAAHTAIQAVVADVSRLEARYSRYRTDSLLADINRVAETGGSIQVDAETASLLDYAAACHAQSGGLFDVTSGLLRHAWRFESGQLPEPARIESLLERVGWHKLRWNPPVLTFPVAGMALDLGGVVKEYAADRAAVLCQNQGIRHGIVNLGGDIRVIGPHADGRPWRLGIQHPRQERTVIRTLELSQGGMASSGDYARCINIHGTRYGHILDPRTGWPVRHLAAVSVWADFCVVAGSASTIAMLKGEEGPAWLRQLGLPHYWVDVEGRTGGRG